MAKKELPTAELIRQILDYNPDTGEFRWKDRTPNMFKMDGHKGPNPPCASWNSRFSGKRAEMLHTDGYMRVQIFKKLHRAHRVAWVYMTGEWPSCHIDHADMNKLNNRWANIREADDSQNACNRHANKNNKSGYKGVSFHKASQLWRSEISIHGKKKYLGYFKRPEEAHHAYVAAAMQLHGEFARGS